MPTWVKFNKTVIGLGDKTYIRGEYACLSDRLVNSMRVDWFDFVPKPTELELARAKRRSRQREAQEKRKII